MARREIIQNHHIFYKVVKEGNRGASQREIIVPMKMHEHRIVSLIQRLKPENSSKGFWHALKVLCEAYAPFAKEVTKDA